MTVSVNLEDDCRMRRSDNAKVESLEGAARRVGGGSDNDPGGAVMPVTYGLAP